jgi:hypothetical protein
MTGEVATDARDLESVLPEDLLDDTELEPVEARRFRRPVTRVELGQERVGGDQIGVGGSQCLVLQGQQPAGGPDGLPMLAAVMVVVSEQGEAVAQLGRGGSKPSGQTDGGTVGAGGLGHVPVAHRLASGVEALGAAAAVVGQVGRGGNDGRHAPRIA